jgi:hypothetical protein
VDIPASAMAEGATYAVSLSEDGASLGRFPASGEADLSAVVTGPVAIALLPTEVNGFVPDTSAAIVENVLTQCTSWIASECRCRI